MGTTSVRAVPARRATPPRPGTSPPGGCPGHRVDEMCRVSGRAPQDTRRHPCTMRRKGFRNARESFQESPGSWMLLERPSCRSGVHPGAPPDHGVPGRRKFLRSGLWRSLVSALDWGSRGPGFKSRQPDHAEHESRPVGPALVVTRWRTPPPSEVRPPWSAAGSAPGPDRPTGPRTAIGRRGRRSGRCVGPPDSPTAESVDVDW